MKFRLGLGATLAALLAPCALAFGASVDPEIPGPILGPGPKSPEPFQPPTSYVPPLHSEQADPLQEHDPDFRPRQVDGLGFALAKTRGGAYLFRDPLGGPPRSAHAHGSNYDGSSQVTMSAAFAADPLCATSGHRVRVVYARPQGYPNNFAAYAPYLREYVRQVNGKILQESYVATGNARATRLKVGCTNGQITLGQVAVQSSRPPGVTTDYPLTSPAQADVWTRSSLGNPQEASAVKYLIFYDVPSSGYLDTGYGYGRDLQEDWTKLKTLNLNWRYTGSAIVYPERWHTYNTLHELMHSMGAVNVSAPHSTSLNHCIDGNDVMCYDDRASGGYSSEGIYSTVECPNGGYNANGFRLDTPGGYPLDCWKDNYFRPTTGSWWVDSRWNLGGKENDFMSFSPSWP